LHSLDDSLLLFVCSAAVAFIPGGDFRVDSLKLQIRVSPEKAIQEESPTNLILDFFFFVHGAFRDLYRLCQLFSMFSLYFQPDLTG
jgi:hypothetical protein